MSAGRLVRKALRMGKRMPSKGLRRFDTCSCHPRAWGLKKGLRRGRRRLEKKLIDESEELG